MVDEARAPGIVRVLPYEPRFEADLVEICWRTGLMGESLEGTGRFEDRRLFAMLFCLQYLRFEPESCFVAVASAEESPATEENAALGATVRERAVGYIIGTTRAVECKRDFDRLMLPRLVARLFLYDWWRHPESFLQTLRFARASRRLEALRGAVGGLSDRLGGPDYPAELHIDLLPDWQGCGCGGRLMKAFLDSIRARGCRGVYLETSDRNLKALPFYRKLGFEPAGEASVSLWRGLEAKTLAMTLRLDSH